MALFRKFFYRRPPDGLLEICERVYVFECCFTADAFEEKNYKGYMEGIIARLRGNYPDALMLAFNFREGETKSQLLDVFMEYDVTIVEYPRQYEGCPLLPLEVIHHFLKSCESWLTLGLQNLLLMHCDRVGWPVLAFMLAALLVYRNLYSGEVRTLDMVHKQAPHGLLAFLSPINPIPSQLRYLQYVTRRNVATEWPPQDKALNMDCVIIRTIPNFDGKNGCRPIFQIYGQNPLLGSDRAPKVLFSTPKNSETCRRYKPAEFELVKIDINCYIQGDVVVECINLHEDTNREVMMFRVMFNTAFIRSNMLILNRDEIDILWDANDLFSKDFRAEVLFSEMATAPTKAPVNYSCSEEKDVLPMEAFAKAQEMFNSVDWLDPEQDDAVEVFQLWSASNTKTLGDASSNAEKAKMNKSLIANDIQSAVTMDSTLKNQSNSLQEFSPNTDVSRKQVDTHDAPNKIGPSLSSKETLIPPSPRDQSPPPSKLPPHPMPAAEDLSLTDSNAPLGDVDRGLGETDTTLAKTVTSSCPTQLTKNAGVEPTCSFSRVDLEKSSSFGSVSPLKIAFSTPNDIQGGGDKSLISTRSSPKIDATSESIPPRPSNVMLSPVEENLTAADPTSAKPLSPPKSCLEENSSDGVETPHQPPITSHLTNSSSNTSASSPAPSLLPTSPVKENFTCGFRPSHLSLFTSHMTEYSTERPITCPPLPLPPPPPPPPPPCTSPSKDNFASGDGPPYLATSTSHLSDGSDNRSAICSSLSPPPLVPSNCCSCALVSPLKEPSSSSVVPPPPSTSPLDDCSYSACSSSPHGSSPKHPYEWSSKAGPTIVATPSTPCGQVTPPPPPPPNPQVTDASSTIYNSSTHPPPTPLELPKERSIGGVPLPLPPPGPTNPPTLSSPPLPPPPAPAANPGFTTSSPSVPSAPPPPVLSTKEVEGPSNSISTTGNRGGGLSVSPSPPPPTIPPPGTKGKGVLSRPITSKNSRTKKLKPLHWLKISRAVSGSLWAEAQKYGEASQAPDIDMSELESLFSAVALSPDGSSKRKTRSRRSMGKKPEKVQLIDHRRASNCEIMLSKVKIPWQDMLSSILLLEESALDVDQVENLIKFCPTKDEVEILKGYKGDKDKLGKCEQFFLELMQVPRIEYKLKVFLFKIQFHSQVSDLRKNLNVLNSAADQIKGSSKLRRIMQTILSLGNALNQGTARGSAVGFRLDSLLKLTETRAKNNRMTLMHYLCKVLADKLPELLDFWQDLFSIEAASKIQLKFLAEEMQAINKGLDKVVHELTMSESDGLGPDQFHKALSEFHSSAEVEIMSLFSLYATVGQNVDSLIVYFGEDPSRCPFEQVISVLLNFVRMFKKSNDENLKQLEFEKKKADMESAEEHLDVSDTG